jgi:hypothetical protein
MDKLSSDQLQQVLDAVPGTLRSLAAERDYWKKEAQVRMLREDAEKVAHAMHEKGINTDVSIDSLVEKLEKAAAEGKLGQIADAVDMVGPDMGLKIASLTNDGSSVASGVVQNELERFIMGGVG